MADIAIVLVGGVTIWLLDRGEYPELTTAFWYILQTITTVGYGDVTPTAGIGRLIGAAFMMLGIAFLAILTASITSSFIDARQAARRAQNAADADAGGIASIPGSMRSSSDSTGSIARTASAARPDRPASADQVAANPGVSPGRVRT